MQVLLNTTGTLDPVVFDDLDGKELSHPTVNFDMLYEYTLFDLRNSNDLQSAISNGYITLNDENGVVITSVEVQLSQVAEGHKNAPVWNADKINNIITDTTGIQDGDCLKYQALSQKLVPGDTTSNSQLPVVSSFATLPSSPSINYQVFYIPFNSVLHWDGANWVGPKTTDVLFGRKNGGTYDVWLHSVGDVNVFPKWVSGGYRVLGIYLPKLSTGSSLKLYNVTAKSDRLVTGDVEVHADSALPNPVYASTGKAKTTFTNERFSDTELVTPVLVGYNSKLQCFFRRTAGRWNNLSVALTMSLVASA